MVSSRLEPVSAAKTPSIFRGEITGLFGAVFAFRGDPADDALLEFSKFDNTSVPFRGVNLGSRSESPGSVSARSRPDDRSIRIVEASMAWLDRSEGKSVVVVVVVVVVANAAVVALIDSGLPSLALMLLLPVASE